MFAGFTVADFACYEPQKWKSNLFNRDRLEVKQKLLAFAREVGGSLLDADGAPLFVEASVEHPALWNQKQVEAQHVFFSRNETARNELDRLIDRKKLVSTLLDDPTPQRNHLVLVISLTSKSLEIALKLHPDASVDRQNTLHKLEDHFAAEKMADLLQHLPGSFAMGLGETTQPVETIKNQVLDLLVSQLQHMSDPAYKESKPMAPLAATTRLFAIGNTLSKTDATSMEPAAQVAWAKEMLSRLLPLYQFMAWSRGNDHVSVRKVLDQEKAVQRQKGLSKNDSVRVLRGLWAGKNGIVQEVDAKGQLKVLVGKMTVKLDAGDVEKRT